LGGAAGGFDTAAGLGDDTACTGFVTIAGLGATFVAASGAFGGTDVVLQPFHREVHVPFLKRHEDLL
jgi:hypothetical protein